MTAPRIATPKWTAPLGNKVAADGSAIAAGSDDGSVYYFLPEA